MLEDQNDSIKKLRNNLENKVRESSVSSNEISKRELYWNEKLEAERNISYELKKELENQQNIVNHFQSIVNDYKLDRDSLRKELDAVSQKLTERNHSINMIEQEVKKVTDAFKRKESALIQEREEAIRKKDAEYLNMKLTFEVCDSS
jgi:chromosome segregation ATPase